MFDKALIRRPADGLSVDLGMLAETLLYYKNTHMIVTAADLWSLVDAAGEDNIFRLIDDGHVTFSFTRDHFGVQQAKDKNRSILSFVQMTPSGHRDEPNVRWEKDDHIRFIFHHNGVDAEKAKAISKKLAARIRGEKLRLGGISLDIPAMSREDLSDRKYTNNVARIVLNQWFPSFVIPSEWHFCAQQEKDTIVVDTNIDFAMLEKSFGKHKNGEFSERNILASIIESKADMVSVAKYSAEFVGREFSSSLLKAKFNTFTLLRDNNINNIRLFESTNVEAKGIRDAINSGKRDSGEFIDLLERSRKFKKWLSDASPEEGLMQEYINSLTRESWLDKILPKSARSATMTGAGALADLLITGGYGTAAGIALGPADTFLLDKILKGWRPNQFVNDELIPFTNPDGR